MLPFGHFQCDFCAAMRMDLSLCSKPITFGSNTIQCNDTPPTSNSWNFTIHYVKYTTGFKTKSYRIFSRIIGSPKQNSRVSVSKKNTHRRPLVKILPCLPERPFSQHDLGYIGIWNRWWLHLQEERWRVDDFHEDGEMV